MSDNTYTIEYFKRQMIEGLQALMTSNASPCDNAWPAPIVDKGEKLDCGALLNSRFFVDGFQDIGVVSACIQFDIEFKDCEAVTDAAGNCTYQWDGNKYEIFSSVSVVGIRLYDMNGLLIDEDGEEGFIEGKMSIVAPNDQEEVAEEIVQAAFSRLSDYEQKRFLFAVLANYNQIMANEG